jgi:TRAP-type C4-dicarboxylate transport system permease large subunit
VTARPRPEDFPTWWSYHQANRVWKRRTGGSLITTAALALIVGGLSGSAALAMLTLGGALGAHLYLRRTR